MSTEKLRVTEKLSAPSPVRVIDSVVLGFEQRQKSRLRAVSETGRELAIMLPRGSILHHGELLLGEDGTVLQVEAASEDLSCVTSRDPLLLARAAYHLGNRHVPVELHDDRLTYQQDHVLDEMVKQLGLPVTHERTRFEPEPGAYARHHEQRHDQDHHHDHHRGTEHHEHARGD